MSFMRDSSTSPRTALEFRLLSWDVHLQKFERGAEAIFDLGAARAVLERTTGFRDIEPGIGEVVGDGYAEVYYGPEPSSDVMVAVRAGSPTVLDLIGRLTSELRMTVFFPNESGFGLAVLGSSQAEDLPDRSWEGWENFGEAWRPPPAVVCEDAAELATVLRVSYEEWEAWAHRRN
jgi:hypothetical protein